MIQTLSRAAWSIVSLGLPRALRRPLSRAAWSIVLALLFVPSVMPVSAQSQFPKALISTEFEAILPRVGLPDAQRVSAMAEYDRYQRATSELRSGSIERYLKDHPDNLTAFSMDDEPRSAEEVRNQVRAYRGLLAQWDTLENALVDSLAALGADGTKLDRVRRSLELRRIEQTTADNFMIRSGTQADLWEIAGRSSKDLDPSLVKTIEDRIAAREAEYVDAVRAIRTAAIEQPERLADLRAKAVANHPRPSAETLQQQMEEAQKQGAEFDPDEWSHGFDGHLQAIAAAFQQSREPIRAARTRAMRLGASILSEAFQGIPQPHGAVAWLAFVRASGPGAFGVDDGGAIRFVESIAAKTPLTADQDQAVAAAFAAWQTAVLGALSDQEPMQFLGGDSKNIQDGLRKRTEASQARTATLKTGVRAAFGLPPETEAIAQDEPDGATDDAGGDGGTPVGVTVAIGLATTDESGDSDGVIVSGGAVALDMSGEHLDGLLLGGDGDAMLGMDAGRTIQPYSKQELQTLLELCEPVESVKPVVTQLHADYLEVAKAVQEQFDAAPSAQMSFGPQGATAPTKEDITARYEAVRAALGAMERADADLFADLSAVIDEACVRQQAQFRARSLARAGVSGAGSSMAFGMTPSHPSGPFVDPESVIRAARVDGAIDAEAATTLREHVATQGHDPILAALKNQFQVTMSNGRELALLESDLFKPAVAGDAGASMTIDESVGKRMHEASEAMNQARNEASTRARQVLDALPALLKESQRPGFQRAADVVRYPETFRDPTDMEPMFTKALALQGLDTAVTAAITTQRTDYRAAYATMRQQLVEVRPKAVMPSFNGGEPGSIEDYQARVRASQAAQRQLERLKTDRDELNRRTMRQLQSTLGEERAKAIGELPAQRKARGLSLPGLGGGLQITVP
ncbi:MAG: hypothetical protein FJ254_08505 [Phycisphaerae bacterium]|nr:hypothetical protein [Phycisphaerae bacterium]